MFRFINKLFFRTFETNQPLLGRWKLKSCDDVKNKINVFYQNRDHCGDIICGKPIKQKDFETPKI